MAEPEQPKKETVRIQLPVPPQTKPTEPSVKPRETVRIQLPGRETGSSPVSSSPQIAPEDISSTNFFPQPKPPTVSRPLSGSVHPPPPVLSPSGPKRETVRIPLVPESLRSAQKKTHPSLRCQMSLRKTRQSPWHRQRTAQCWCIGCSLVFPH